jgi:four helix bundle protein
MGCFKDLMVYKKAYDLAMLIFQITGKFPREEKFGLTSQIRRSSRSVCSNIAEGYRKRQYPAHFICKMSDADMENSETLVWIDFACSCGYIDQVTQSMLTLQSEEIGRLLSYMITNPEKFKNIR